MVNYTGGSIGETIIAQVMIPISSVSGGVLVQSSSFLWSDNGEARNANFRFRAGSLGTVGDPVYAGSIFFALNLAQARVYTGIPMNTYVTGLNWAGSNFVTLTFQTNNGSGVYEVKPVSINSWGA